MDASKGRKTNMLQVKTGVTSVVAVSALVGMGPSLSETSRSEKGHLAAVFRSVKLKAGPGWG